ncbi:hypothetical protein PBAL39_05408 [Pedobacter sp. BAL39]|nr:hypothetical protein PBAL39_05408 [Pedobacter sp. BAL39]
MSLKSLVADPATSLLQDRFQMKTNAINTRLKALFDDITLPGDFCAPSLCAIHQLRQALITASSQDLSCCQEWELTRIIPTADG